VIKNIFQDGPNCFPCFTLTLTLPHQDSVQGNYRGGRGELGEESVNASGNRKRLCGSDQRLQKIRTPCGLIRNANRPGIAAGCMSVTHLYFHVIGLPLKFYLNELNLNYCCLQ
jgi:hypothetical protein